MKSHKKDNKYRGSSKQRSVDIFSCSVVNISYDAKKELSKKKKQKALEILFFFTLVSTSVSAQ